MRDKTELRVRLSAFQWRMACQEMDVGDWASVVDVVDRRVEKSPFVRTRPENDPKHAEHDSDRPDHPEACRRKRETLEPPNHGLPNVPASICERNATEGMSARIRRTTGGREANLPRG
ncbi:MAG TPA: hypothetical protein VHE30_04010 [Polyangiaceae bacterium]|nr:hypothetical protein [Polyangiaceae bacterium]